MKEIEEFKSKFIEASILFNSTDCEQYFIIRFFNTGGYMFIITDRNIDYDDNADMDVDDNNPYEVTYISIGDCTGCDYGEIKVMPWLSPLTDENILTIVNLLKKSLNEDIEYNDLQNGDMYIYNNYTVSWKLK